MKASEKAELGILALDVVIHARSICADIASGASAAGSIAATRRALVKLDNRLSGIAKRGEP